MGLGRVPGLPQRRTANTSRQLSHAPCSDAAEDRGGARSRTDRVSDSRSVSSEGPRHRERRGPKGAPSGSLKCKKWTDSLTQRDTSQSESRSLRHRTKLLHVPTDSRTEASKIHTFEYDSCRPAARWSDVGALLEPSYTGMQTGAALACELCWMGPIQTCQRVECQRAPGRTPAASRCRDDE